MELNLKQLAEKTYQERSIALNAIEKRKKENDEEAKQKARECLEACIHIFLESFKSAKKENDMVATIQLLKIPTGQWECLVQYIAEEGWRCISSTAGNSAMTKLKKIMETVGDNLNESFINYFIEFTNDIIDYFGTEKNDEGVMLFIQPLKNS